MPKREPPHDHSHDHAHEEEDEALAEASEEMDEDLEELDDDGDVVVLVDAEGNETEYHMLGVVEVDEETFALLTPVEEEEDEESESLEIVLMRYDEDEDGGMIFADIDNDDLFVKVQAMAEKYMAELMTEEEAQ